MDKTLSSFLDADMVCFIKLLIDKGRINSLTEILDEYVRLADEHLGIEKAVVWELPEISKEKKQSDHSVSKLVSEELRL